METKKQAIRAGWQKHIEKCQASGMSQGLYCKKNDLHISTFQYWKKRLKEESARPGANSRRSRFIELASFPPGPDPLIRPVIEVSLSSDLRVSGRFNFDLSRILREMIQ